MCPCKTNLKHNENFIKKKMKAKEFCVPSCENGSGNYKHLCSYNKKYFSALDVFINYVDMIDISYVNSHLL